MTRNHTPSCEHCDDPRDFCVVGVDVSKKHLDAHELPSGRARRFANTRAGIRALGAWVCPGVRWVVYESTGSYHLSMEDGLLGVLPLTRINPARAKYFAKAIGVTAKTDRVDALLLATLGRMMPDALRPTPPRRERDAALAELCTARYAVAKAKAVLKCRLEHARNPLVRREIQKDVKRAAAQIARINAELARLVAEDAAFSRKVALLETIIGIRAPTAIALLVEVPELGTLTTRQAASLVGLAPVADDSGERQGARCVKDGRKRARTLLYMPAMTAVGRNPVMRELHEARKARGMAPRKSLIVAMRKLVVMANAIIRDGEPFRADHVPEAPATA